MSHIFTSLIRCECGYNYRFIKERGINKYVCSGYSKRLNGGCTKRNILNEKVLLDMIQIFCNRSNIELAMNNDFMKTIIKTIYIDSQCGIIIKYYNGDVSEITSSRINI